MGTACGARRTEPTVTRMQHLVAWRPMRRFAMVSLFAACVVVPALPARTTHADDTAAEQAAREIADAREQANQAADAYFEAESTLDSLSVDQQQLEGQLTDLQGQVAALQERVQQVAVNRFTRSSAQGSPILNGFDTPEEMMQVEALAQVINDTSDTEFDEYDSLNRDIRDKQRELQRTKSRTEQQKSDMAALREQALAKVEQLKKIEAQRLKDDAVRKALDAENKRRAEKTAAEAAKKAADKAAATSKNGDGGVSRGQTGAVGNSSGGTTGFGGSGGRPGGSGGNDWGGVEWVCPTGTAAVGFSDTWGAPRSGGRRHEGVDMIGQRGTPILAVVNGIAQPGTNELGGTTVWFIGDDGNSYYYAHLDAWRSLGRVQKGDIIGILGDTGNAKFSTPHLHFEIHPGHGDAVDPYPTVRAHC